MEQVVAQLQAVTVQLEQVRLAQTTAETRVQELETQLATGRPVGKGAGKGSEFFLDVRSLRGLDTFDGSSKAWRDWAILARSYAETMNPTLGTVMEAAETGTEDVRNLNFGKQPRCNFTHCCCTQQKERRWTVL